MMMKRFENGETRAIRKYKLDNKFENGDNFEDQLKRKLLEMKKEEEKEYLARNKSMKRRSSSTTSYLNSRKKFSNFSKSS